MKKFLIFLVSTIVAVCIGVTFYQFAKNDEVIKFDTKTVYVNYGDKLSLDDLGFSRTEANKDTEINFNAGGDEVTSIIKYDEISKSYIPTQKGGSTTIKITTNNRKYKNFSIDVVVGIGTEEYPFYISNEEQLFDIGTKYSLTSCFELVNDITLEQAHTPIGLVDGKYNEFVGQFNGGYHTINNLKIESCDFGGLFATLGANSLVYNLSVNNAILDGSYINAGVIAGICYGNINKVIVSNPTINNTNTSGNTGAVVGLLQTDKIESVTAGILRTSAYTDQNTTITASGNLGGLAGKVDSAIIHACHTNLNLKNSVNSATGGLVGEFLVSNDSYIRESYSISQIEATGGNTGNLIGIVALNSNTKLADVNKSLVLVGLYYNNTVNSLSGVGSDISGFASATTFAINGKSTTEMKSKVSYVYYVNSTNKVVYWDKVWYLVDGEYPSLTFVTKFDDVVLEDDSQSTTTPENPSDNPTNPDITNPDTPSANTNVISSKEDLVATFQKGSSISGDYIITNDIDLGGMVWTPVSFSGTLKTADGTSKTISNFTIDATGKYVGFFSTLSSANISQIEFKDVTIESENSHDAMGVVVGYIRGNTTLSSINVTNATISAPATYAGSVVGYVGNTVTNINLTFVKNVTIDKALNVGGVAGYIAENVYIGGAVVDSNTTITGVDRVGGITAVNYGKINKSTSDGSINTTSTASAAGYIGGLSAVNYGTVLNCFANAEISVLNNAKSSSSIYYFVGGLCGYNLGELKDCKAYADCYTANNSTNDVYLGGLTGYNVGTISYCMATVGNVGEEARANVYVGGLSAYNYGGTIYGCATIGKLNGYIVAGLVVVNGNDGVIDSCMTARAFNVRAEFKGIILASFVYEISSGSITNCLVNAKLNCTSNSGWIAGFAGFMPYSDNKYGTISHSIANVSFSGSGKMYLDIAQDGLMKKDRTTGTITNCVISEDANVSGVIVSKYSKFLWFSKDAGSGSNYVVATTAKIQDINTYLDPSTCDFDIDSGDVDSKWYYISNRVPTPRAVWVIFDSIDG